MLSQTALVFIGTVMHRREDARVRWRIEIGNHGRLPRINGIIIGFKLVLGKDAAWSDCSTRQEF